MDILRCPPFLLVPAPSPPSQPWTFMSSSGQHLSSSGWTVKLFTAGTCLPLESEVVFLQQSKLVSEKGSWLGLISNIWMYFVWKPVLSTLSSILLLRDSWQDSNVTQQKTKTSAERKNEQRGKEKKKKPHSEIQPQKTHHFLIKYTLSFSPKKHRNNHRQEPRLLRGTAANQICGSFYLIIWHSVSRNIYNSPFQKLICLDAVPRSLTFIITWVN